MKTATLNPPAAAAPVDLTDHLAAGIAEFTRYCRRHDLIGLALELADDGDGFVRCRLVGNGVAACRSLIIDFCRDKIGLEIYGKTYPDGPHAMRWLATTADCPEDDRYIAAHRDD